MCFNTLVIRPVGLYKTYMIIVITGANNPLLNRPAIIQPVKIVSAVDASFESIPVRMEHLE